MMSYRIDKDEIDEIFKEGYSGRHASRFAGEGLGMLIIKRCLLLNGVDMDIIPDYSVTETYKDEQYVKNKFVFEYKVK